MNYLFSSAFAARACSEKPCRTNTTEPESRHSKANG